MQSIDLKDYTYDLPQDRIAKFPVEPRDSSKLLLYNKGKVKHHTFHELPSILPKNARLVFNNTKVIPARIFFQKPTGAVIELFLLQPIAPFTHVNDAMDVKGECVWKCAVGNLKRWNDGLELVLSLPEGFGELKATLINREQKKVQLSWTNASLNFAEMLIKIGEVPLPPYLNRKPVERDKQTYQTVYSKEEGAVAAPTAGLHFTPQLIEQLHQQGIPTEEITLHVSAGTFKPIKVDNVIEHPMHTEQVVITQANLEALLNTEYIINVGTTSMRTLESLYWFGVKILQEDSLAKKIPFEIEKLIAYQAYDSLPNRKEALNAVLAYMKQLQKQQLYGETSIFILPGYDFKMSDGLITNFHQPGSTLILLIAAFVGPSWEKIYQEALDNDYRFLSYGDSSLLLRE